MTEDQAWLFLDRLVQELEISGADLNGMSVEGYNALENASKALADGTAYELVKHWNDERQKREEKYDRERKRYSLDMNE